MTQLNPPLRLVPRADDAHKGDFGRVALVGGSRGMAGSLSLSSLAALRCGSGLVTSVVPDRCLETVASFHPALMTWPLADDSVGRFDQAAVLQLSEAVDKCDAVGCGPGMRTSIGSTRIVERLLQPVRREGKSPTGILMDADAINVLSQLRWSESPHPVAMPFVLTPHPGELQRLSGAAANDRALQIDAAQKIAAAKGVVIVVKGGPTVVVSDNERWVNTTGNPGMATAGAGDVLTGVITSLLGQGLSAWDAARLGVWIHGQAGDRAAKRLGMASMTAVDLLDELPAAVQAAT